MSGSGDSPEIEWTPVKVKLGDLSHWADNPVTLTKAQAGKLLKSKAKLGKMQTLAIGPSNGDGKHPLYDGHQRANVWGAAFGMGLEVWALQSSRLLTDDERHAVPIMLRTAAGSFDWDVLSGWTDYPLGEWGLDDDALQGLKFDIAALGNLLESETPEPADAPPQIDRAAELLEKWQVKTGDLWRLGEHYLLCGDSTKREDVERVMQGEKAQFSFTDPPYNVGVSYTKETDDKMARDKFVAWSKEWAQYLPSKFCITVGVKRLLWWRDILGDPQWTIAWVKMNGQSNTGLGGTNKWDPILVYGCKPDNQIDLIEQNNDYSEQIVSSGNHPTPKPVGLWRKVLERFSGFNDVVFEPFCGTGTTIIACQNLGRKCRAIEISPAYCAVTLERMATAFPGIEIERIATSAR